nr:hypothetical protein SHINE37_80052 [Rhizobiaceae bacterium]
MCIHPVTLSITHKFSSDGCTEGDVSKTGEASPHDDIAWWRVLCPGEVTA